MRKTKKAYFEKLNIKEIGGNKTFWKTAWPCFSDKGNKSSKITLVENNIEPLTKNCDNHISRRKIKEAYREIVPDSFHFKSVSLDDVKKEVLNLNQKKSSISGTIRVTILKQTIDVHLQQLANVINDTLQTNCFPEEIKLIGSYTSL